MNRVFGVTGWKNSGKTTLVANLVEEFTRRSLKVSTVKHASKSYQLDLPGTDTFNHRAAGAHEVAIVSQGRWALMHEARDDEAEHSLDAMLDRLAPCDLVIVEGFKASDVPKIECIRNASAQEQAIWRENKSVVAIAADDAVEDCPLTILDMNNIAAIADYIAEHVRLTSK